MNSKARAYCFTLNNYTDEDIERIQAIECRYLVFGREVGEQGTPHLQGYISFKNARRGRAVKELLGSRVHLEGAKGSPKQNRQYCTKAGDFIEKGEIPQQGKRSDLQQIKKAIDDGKSENYLWDKHFNKMVIYRRAFSEYRNSRASKRTMPSRVFIFHGPTGTGKTRRAWAIDPDSTWVHAGGNWFDGYCGQRVAVFDEFDGDDIPFKLWKKLCDRYPMQVPIKGGFRNWNPAIIVFTSNKQPTSWWAKEEGKSFNWYSQVERRVEKVVLMNEEWDPSDDPLKFN